MKRLIASILVFMLLLGGCTGGKSPPPDLEKLLSERGDWQRLAEKKQIVLCTEDGTVNLPLLEKWVDAYKVRKDGTVTIAVDDGATPSVCTLTCYGKDRYTVDWHDGSGGGVTYEADKLYSRKYDYILGVQTGLHQYDDIRIELSVKKGSVTAVPLTYDAVTLPSLGEITPQHAQINAVSAENGLWGTPRDNSYDRRYGVRPSLSKPNEYLSSRVSGAIEVEGSPYYLVETYFGQRTVEENVLLNRMAVCADNGSVLCETDAGWIMLYDAAEVLIKGSGGERQKALTNRQLDRWGKYLGKLPYALCDGRYYLPSNERIGQRAGDVLCAVSDYLFNTWNGSGEIASVEELDAKAVLESTYYALQRTSFLDSDGKPFSESKAVYEALTDDRDFGGKRFFIPETQVAAAAEYLFSYTAPLFQPQNPHTALTYIPKLQIYASDGNAHEVGNIAYPVAPVILYVRKSPDRLTIRFVIMIWADGKRDDLVWPGIIWLVPSGEVQQYVDKNKTQMEQYELVLDRETEGFVSCKRG